MRYAPVVLSVLTVSAVSGQDAAPLPPGVRAVWDAAAAEHLETGTRGRLCLGGLWRWQPSAADVATAPTGSWGWFKVPAPWPGIQDYLQSDYHAVIPHAAWGEVNLGGVTTAWYEREIDVPEEWAGRRIALTAGYVNSFAMVLIDGRPAGEVRFPGGELELTGLVRPGGRHRLSLRVDALPLRGVMLSYNDTNAAREVRGSVARRGLCGDVFLVSTPTGARLGAVRLETSVARGEITVVAEVDGAEPGARLTPAVILLDGAEKVGELVGEPAAVVDGELRFTAAWRAPKLWDLHTPENQYTAELSIADGQGVVDRALPVRFGYREFGIAGRDFQLNGTRLWLSAVPLDNAQIGAAVSTYSAARESFERLKSFGINFVYTHNYGCEPGSHLSFEEILRAADDTGMLVALSQPHFGAYDWQAADADATNGYARHARFYCQVAGSHPSVVAYSTSHNATGYSEDMNPDLMDGVREPRDEWAQRNAQRALRAEAILRRLDPSRIVYHHSSGNLGSLHTSNFYPNWVPVQELDDWFGPWSQGGAKPVFLVEYGAPFGWDWTMYRGWFNGRREFGGARVPWEYCLAEWNAQFLGDKAYELTDAERENLRWEAAQFGAGRVWNRWDYPNQVGDRDIAAMQPVQAKYTRDNWRAFRTWGLSANSPWEHHRFWTLRPNFERRRQDLPTDWDRLQRPGYSPDFIERTYERMDVAYERDDWLATPTADELYRNNRPLLAYLAGKPERFTSKDHLFRAGETVAKQIVIINNRRTPVAGTAEWSVDLPTPQQGTTRFELPTGEQRRVPVSLDLPADLAPGRHAIRLTVRFDDEAAQSDEFAFTVLPPRPAVPDLGRVLLFDPVGDTATLLRGLGVPFETIGAGDDPRGADLLVLGRGAITPGGALPDLAAVADGLKVVIFEQTAAALEQRLGLRVTEYGLRDVFTRLADHPVLAGLPAEAWHDWRGEATLTPPRLDYTLSATYSGAPAVRWCGLEVTRAWRCGNQGNLASVLIEKPVGGDFLPILDGGYALQYSPLLEYRQGAGRIVFCQLDVTGRSEPEPAAELLVANLLDYARRPADRASHPVVYVGEAAGAAWLASAGITPVAELTAGCLLVAGPGAAGDPRAAEARRWLADGGRLAGLGLSADDLGALLAEPPAVRAAEYLNAPLTPLPIASPFAGISPGDLHNRDPRELPLITGGANIGGGGILATRDGVVLCGLAPWRFDPAPERFNQRRTFRRASTAAARLLANQGARFDGPLMRGLAEPVGGAVGPSRVTNGDFAADADGDGRADDWTLTCEAPAATWQRVATADGGWAQRVTIPAGDVDAPGLMFAQANVPVEGGAWYRLALRARAENLSAREVTAAIQNTATWQAVIEYQRFAPGPDWQRFEFTVRGVDTATATRLQIWCDATGLLELGDVVFEPIADPTRGRWLDGLYLDAPTEWDDPYRFFRW